MAHEKYIRQAVVKVVMLYHYHHWDSTAADCAERYELTAKVLISARMKHVQVEEVTGLLPSLATPGMQAAFSKAVVRAVGVPAAKAHYTQWGVYPWTKKHDSSN